MAIIWVIAVITSILGMGVLWAPLVEVNQGLVRASIDPTARSNGGIGTGVVVSKSIDISLFPIWSRSHKGGNEDVPGPQWFR